MSDLDRLLAQVEELKKLAQRPDDSWMDNMSTDELLALGKRVRKVADGLSGLQNQMARDVSKARGGAAPQGRPPAAQAQRFTSGSGSLGNMVRRDAGSASGQWTPPADKPAVTNPFPTNAAANDLANPMGRRRVGGGSPVPREAPSVPPAPSSAMAPWQKPKPTDQPPARGRNRRPF